MVYPGVNSLNAGAESPPYTSPPDGFEFILNPISIQKENPIENYSSISYEEKKFEASEELITRNNIINPNSFVAFTSSTGIQINGISEIHLGAEFEAFIQEPSSDCFVPQNTTVFNKVHPNKKLNPSMFSSNSTNHGDNSKIKLDLRFSKPNLIFPNPAEDYLFVNCPESLDLIIMDLSGRTVLFRRMQKGRNQLDISNLKHGVHMVHLIGTASNSTVKLLKQ